MTALCKQKEKEYKERDKQLYDSLNCFWSWPWGHCYHTVDSEDICCKCGKRVLNY